MNYDADAPIIVLECERLRSQRRRHVERMSSSQEVLPAIKMLIGDWYVDELGIPTREYGTRIAVLSLADRLRSVGQKKNPKHDRLGVLQVIASASLASSRAASGCRGIEDAALLGLRHIDGARRP